MSPANSSYPAILDCIALHESGARQFDRNGNPLISDTGDVGFMQIHIATWKPLADKMGLDILHNPTDNIEMGIWIYNHQGSKPWTTAKYCAGEA